MSDSAAVSQATIIFNIPPELHNYLFQFLDPVASTCLGLTCKSFYNIHRSFNGTVSLGANTSDENGRPLHEFLGRWIGEGLSDVMRIRFVYEPDSNKFRDVEDIYDSEKAALVACGERMIEQAQYIQNQSKELEINVLQAMQRMRDVVEDSERMQLRMASGTQAIAKFHQNLKVCCQH